MIDELSDKVGALQAIIFAADSPCDEERLAAVLDVPVEEIEGLVAELARRMEESALQVVRLAGGYQLATRPRYAGYVQRLREPEPERLSPQALETLAIIAYLQPITRPEIDDIRGVNSTGCVNSLLEKGLVEISGRRDAPGRPFLLVTTSHFLSTFGLNDLEQLPELSPADVDFEQQLRDLVGEDGTGVEDIEAEDRNVEVTEAEHDGTPGTAPDEEGDDAVDLSAEADEGHPEEGSQP